MVPAALSSKLFKPINGSSRFRKHGCRPRVLHRIGQTAALGDGAKPVLVIFRHVLRIDGKERISRCIRSNPFEYPYPIILWRHIRPFNMWSRRKKLALSEEHQSAKRQEQRDPPPHLATQDIFAQDASAQQEQHNVNQMKAAHGLEARGRLESCRNREYKGRNKIEESVDDQRSAENRELRLGSGLRETCNQEEQNQRSQRS